MHVRTRAAVALAAAGLGVTGVSVAQTPDEDYGGRARFAASLDGFAEVPPVSTRARGSFRADFSGRRIRWTLRYSGIEGGAVTQAHIHFGQRRVNGGVSAFLCSNLAGAPAGTQPCPARGGFISGTIRPRNVVGPVPQGIRPGEFGELLRAMRAGFTYANVHSTAFPNGEIRGQIVRRRR